MESFDQDPILNLMVFLRTQEGIESKLAQEMVNAHLLHHFTLLSVFAFIFIIGVGIARTAGQRHSTLRGIEQAKGLGSTIALLAFLASTYPLYNLAQGFLFPRVVILNELARLFE